MRRKRILCALFIFLISVIGNCITNEREACHIEVRKQYGDCRDDVVPFLVATSNANQTQTAIQKENLFNLFIFACLIKLEAKRKCNKKSAVIPTIAPN